MDYKGPNFKEAPNIFLDISDRQLIFKWGENRYRLKDLIRHAIQVQKKDFKLGIKPSDATGIYNLTTIECNYIWHRFLEVAFCPKEDLPLYINNDFNMVKEIAVERLKYLSE